MLIKLSIIRHMMKWYYDFLLYIIWRVVIQIIQISLFFYLFSLKDCFYMSCKYYSYQMLSSHCPGMRKKEIMDAAIFKFYIEYYLNYLYIKMKSYQRKEEFYKFAFAVCVWSTFKFFAIFKKYQCWKLFTGTCITDMIFGCCIWISAYIYFSKF